MTGSARAVEIEFVPAAAAAQAPAALTTPAESSAVIEEGAGAGYPGFQRRRVERFTVGHVAVLGLLFGKWVLVVGPQWFFGLALAAIKVFIVCALYFTRGSVLAPAPASAATLTSLDPRLDRLLVCLMWFAIACSFALFAVVVFSDPGILIPGEKNGETGLALATPLTAWVQGRAPAGDGGLGAGGERRSPRRSVYAREYSRVAPGLLFCTHCEMCLPEASDAGHCPDCGVCVASLDHHCPWTSKCVGGRNVRLFYAWVGVSLLTLILLSVSTALRFDDVTRRAIGPR